MWQNFLSYIRRSQGSLETGISPMPWELTSHRWSQQEHEKSMIMMGCGDSWCALAHFTCLLFPAVLKVFYMLFFWSRVQIGNYQSAKSILIAWLGFTFFLLFCFWLGLIPLRGWWPCCNHIEIYRSMKWRKEILSWMQIYPQGLNRAEASKYLFCQGKCNYMLRISVQSLLFVYMEQ